MKEIKTVVKPIEQACEFDTVVNKLLADNWILNKRNILSTQGQPSEAFNIPVIRVLYAELERNVVPFEEVTI